MTARKTSFKPTSDLVSVRASKSYKPKILVLKMYMT